MIEIIRNIISTNNLYHYRHADITCTCCLLYATGVPVITSLTYDVSRGVVTCLSEGDPVTNITWNRVGVKTTAVLNRELLIYQSNLTITGTNISDYTGIFRCTVSNIKGQTSSEIGPYKGNIIY